MGFTKEQVNQMYRIKLKAVLDKIAVDRQRELDKEKEEWQDQQQFWNRLNVTASFANAGKNIRETIVGEMRKVKYAEDEIIDGAIVQQRKWDYKKDPGLIEGALFPLEKTEGYKEFKRKEYLESPKFAEKKETFKEESLSWLKDEKVRLRREQSKAADIMEKQLLEEELAEISEFLEEEEKRVLALKGIENAKFNQYGLTKTRASELTDILEREGVILPEGITEEKTLELLSAFDKVPMGENPVGALATDQPEYRAFMDTLKSGVQNPETFQSVVTDLTTNTDETIQSVIDGTYTPEVEDVSYERDFLKEERELGRFIEEEKDILFEDPGAGATESAPGEEFIESEYTAELEEWEKDLGIGEPGVFTAEELENMPAPAAMTLPTGAPSGRDEPAELILDERILDPDYPLTNAEIAKGLGLQSASQISKEDMQNAIKMFPNLPPEEALNQYYNYGEVEGIVSTGAETIEDIAGLSPTTDTRYTGFGDAPLDVKAPDIEISGVEIPDAEAPDAGAPGYASKAFEGAQALLQLKNIRDTLTNEDATDVEKGVASVQGTKMIADLTKKYAKKEGVKVAGKAVGAATGGVLGGYTMVTGAKEAGEAWGEEDYDEAILHGMGSASGALQLAGGGMMATGVGAPLGAILYGVGTAGSLISSAGLFLENIFEKKDAEAPIQRFNVGNYLDTIRGRDTTPYRKDRRYY